MRKSVIALALAAVTGIAVAGAGFAARMPFTMSLNKTITHLNFSSGVRVDTITVKYAATASNVLYVCAVQDGLTVIRQVIGVTNATSVVYNPTGLWMKPADTLVLSNAVSAACAGNIEYVY